jgi:hypothetical protein
VRLIPPTTAPLHSTLRCVTARTLVPPGEPRVTGDPSQARRESLAGAGACVRRWTVRGSTRTARASGVSSPPRRRRHFRTLESGQHVRLAWHHSQWLPSAAMGAPSHPPPQHATSFGPLYSALDSAPVSPPLANQRPLTLQCLAHLCMIELSTHTTSCPPTPINAVGHGRSVLKLRSTSGAWNRPRRRTLQHCTEPRVARTTQTDHRMRKGS